MSKGQNVQALQIGGTPVSVDVTASSVATAIPPLETGVTLDTGSSARFVRVANSNVAGVEVYVKPGLAAAVATLGDGILMPADGHGLIINVSGSTHLAIIGSAASGEVNIVPLANQ